MHRQGEEWTEANPVWFISVPQVTQQFHMGFNCSGHPPPPDPDSAQLDLLHIPRAVPEPGNAGSRSRTLPSHLWLPAKSRLLPWHSPGTAQGRDGSGGREGQQWPMARGLAPSSPEGHHLAGNVPLKLSSSSRASSEEKGWILKHHHLYTRNNCCNIFLGLLIQYDSRFKRKKEIQMHTL